MAFPHRVALPLSPGHPFYSPAPPFSPSAGGRVFFPLQTRFRSCYPLVVSWKIIEKYRAILACEEGVAPRDWGGKLSVCLVYPNRYHIAMGNLGFQAVYRLLNAR